MRVGGLFRWSNAAPAAATVSGMTWSAESYVTTQPWFSSLPLGWVTLVLLGIWFGQDIVNPHGRLWSAVAWFKDLVHVGEVEYKPQMRDRGANHGGQKQEIEITLPITFRSSRTIDIVRIVADVFSYDGKIPGKHKKTYSWNAYESLHPAKGETVHLHIADVPYEYEHPGFYGDLNEGGAWLYPSTVHDIKIEICSGRRMQYLKLAIVVPWSNVTASQSGLNPGGRFQIYQNASWLFPGG